MQNYNWYSTNSLQRFQRSNAEQRPTQFSDEGRHHLGSASDPESVAMREMIINSVSEETLQKWVDFQKKQRDGCVLRKFQLGIKQDPVDERLRNYPKKVYEIEEDVDTEMQGGSDGSQPSKNDYDRSKYVLNRKLNPISTLPTVPSAEPQSAVESVSSDQIFVDDSQPSPISTRWVISGKENHGDKQVTSTGSDYQVTLLSVPSQEEKSSRKVASGMSEEGSTLIVTVPSSSTNAVQECILNKYGHCFAPTVCPFAHDGVVRKNGGKIKMAPAWQRKLPNTEICSGYLNLECWDSNCDDRHTVYPSDIV